MPPNVTKMIQKNNLIEKSWAPIVFWKIMLYIEFTVIGTFFKRKAKSEKRKWGGGLGNV